MGRHGRVIYLIGLTEGILLLVLGALRVFTSSYFWTRWEGAIHPENDPLGVGYLPMIIRSALEKAQWIGVGAWARGDPYEVCIVDAESDFFLTTIIHKLGWLPFREVKAPPVPSRRFNITHLPGSLTITWDE